MHLAQRGVAPTLGQPAAASHVRGGSRSAFQQLSIQQPRVEEHSSHGRRSVTTCAQRGRGAVRGAERAAESAKQEGQGLIGGIAAAKDRLNEHGVDLNSIVAQSGLLGVTFGTLFQITHNVGYLPVYDVWAFNLGPFPEAGTIPLLLAPIWLLWAAVQPIADEFVGGVEVADAKERASDLTYVATCWAALAAHFLLSDLLYQTGMPHWVCSVTLATIAFAIWKKFDNTKSGAFLAALLTAGAPMCETFIVNVLGLWHYERPDFFGVPHWAGWCYACYSIGVGNVARCLQYQQERSR